MIDYSNFESEILPIIKFNNSDGAIICVNCWKIIKSGLTKEEFEGNTDLKFCSEECKERYYNNFYSLYGKK